MNEIREALRRAEAAVALLVATDVVEGIEKDELERLLSEVVTYLRAAVERIDRNR